MKKSHREDTVGPWAEQKLDALESYLKAYMTVMKNQRFRLVFVDAFAGAGVSKVRGTGVDATTMLSGLLDDDEVVDEEKFIAGSPVRALSLDRPFDHYFFFDADPRRVELLSDLKKQFPNHSITTVQGDANQQVLKVASRFTARDLRGVAFLDPYGPNLNWATVEALARTGKFDVIINFPLDMAINRLITRDGKIPKNWANQLDKCFGTPEWHDLAFDETPVDLFGQTEVHKREDTASRLLSLYHGRLKTAFGHVSKPSLVRNTRDHPLYYLIWASSNRRGLPIADHILGLGDKVKVPR